MMTVDQGMRLGKPSLQRGPLLGEPSFNFFRAFFRPKFLDERKVLTPYPVVLQAYGVSSLRGSSCGLDFSPDDPIGVNPSGSL